MTAIKQVAVTSVSHASNLGRYLNDERGLMHDSQHIVNEERWEAEMAKTREAYGHDLPARAGAKNTIMYHQVLAFNPDECDVNGGKVTPVFAMAYAKEYVATRYPNQEAVWALHHEHCKADGTSRYAVHIGINRTDLETGRRLNEGRSKNAKIERANAVRDMDKKHGLRQMVANERNSSIHARQPTRQEKAMAARGIRSDKQYVRDAVKASVAEAKASPEPNKARALAKSLDAKGVKMTVAKSGRDFTFERKKTGRKVSGTKLGRGFSMQGIAKGLGMKISRQVANGIAQDMDR